MLSFSITILFFKEWRFESNEKICLLVCITYSGWWFSRIYEEGGRVKANFNYIASSMNLDESDINVIAVYGHWFYSVDQFFSFFIYIHDTGLSKWG